MTSRVWIAAGLGLASAAMSFPAASKVDTAQAAKLKKELTPVGGERGANKDGSIPAWDGGLSKAPAGFKPGSRYTNPFPGDKPKFTISASNLDQYRDKLSAGQLTMFKNYGDTYKIPVYETRRTFANPQFIYDATFKNATSASLGGDGEALNGAVTGIPFPIPANGHEVIWNHKVRYRDLSVRRWNNQFAVTTSGAYNQVKIQEDVKFSYSADGIQPSDLNNIILYFLQITTEPARLAGTILLVHETMDQVKEARKAWQYNPGQRRLRRAPNVGYDNPGSASDGLRTNDQTDSFNGALDRYSWRLLGKREMLIPYNAYRVHSGALDYSELLGDQHLNQTHTRYELHRVWVVEAEVKPGTSHLYARRVFYVDEDSWQIHAVDIYDKRGSLWRIQDAHSLMAYDQPYMFQALEVIYDLQAGRYLVHAMSNQEPERAPAQFDSGYFEPANAKRLGRR